MGLQGDNYEPTPREAVITEALDAVQSFANSFPLDNGDVAAFIEGYLQVKELAGKF